MENEAFQDPIRLTGEAPPFHPAAEGSPPSAPPARLHRRSPTGRSRKIAFWMFLVTLLSTFWVGMVAGGGAIYPSVFFQVTEAVRDKLVLSGLTYSGSLLLILGFHEMGHYLQALRYGIPASFPYFIPMPFSPFGTMGAVIIQGDHAGNRKTLFDIAVSGPLAGLVVAIPLLYLGLSHTGSAPLPPNPVGIIYGDPPILRWMFEALHGPVPPGHEIILTPLVFAAWVGIFITSLNLIPVGQLDGGHILYALLRRKAYPVALGCLGLAIGYMIFKKNITYGLLVGLLLLMGPFHPPTGDDDAPLDWPRIVLGWLTLSFIIIGFTPDPIIVPTAG
jgi:membrane-associated protease RseP (regulator of RpoE activity)